MRWSGESKAHRDKRLREWHRRFAFLPTQMSDGGWVWLESYWAIDVAHPWSSDGPTFELRAGLRRPDDTPTWAAAPVTPPPTRPQG